MPLTPIAIKIYTALLSQTGTDDPIATILQNTIGTITLNRERTGVYSLTTSGLFTLNKTIVLPYGDFQGAANTFLTITDESAVLGYTQFNQQDINVINWNVVDTSFNFIDWADLCGTTKQPIQITVYS